MKKIVFMFVWLVSLITMTICLGCGSKSPTQPTINNDPKQIAITMPATIIGDVGQPELNLAVNARLFPVGSQPMYLTMGLEYDWGAIATNAYTLSTYSGVDPITNTSSLLNVSGNNPWTGSGTYDIYIILTSWTSQHFYKKVSVNFSSTTTQIQISSADEIFELPVAPPKTLSVSMPASLYNYATAGFSIRLYRIGQQFPYLGVLAGASNSTPGVSVSGTDPVTLTLPLGEVGDLNYTLFNPPWTGSGAFTIYAFLDGGGGHIYRKLSVNIISATTSIQISSADEFFN